MVKKCMTGVFAIVALAVMAATGRAALIAEYNFDKGLANSASALYSPLSVIGSAPDLSYGRYHSDGNNSNYLEVAPAVGGANPFTVSVWVWSDIADQGGFKGIFSNNDNGNADYSFQLDSHNGDYRAVGVDIPTRSTPASAGVWQNLVYRKTSGSQGNFWVDGVQVGANFGANPGGLQEFRIGINRNSDNSFSGLIDNVQIWNTAESAAAIYAAGPGLATPEPTTLLIWSLLAGLGVCLGWRRRTK